MHCTTSFKPRKQIICNNTFENQDFVFQPVLQNYWQVKNQDIKFSLQKTKIFFLLRSSYLQKGRRNLWRPKCDNHHITNTKDQVLKAYNFCRLKRKLGHFLQIKHVNLFILYSVLDFFGGHKLDSFYEYFKPCTIVFQSLFFQTFLLMICVLIKFPFEVHRSRIKSKEKSCFFLMQLGP